MERARRIIDHCAHPAYRDYLHRYLESSRHRGISAMTWRSCFEMHLNLTKTGQMLPELDLRQFD
jgi:propionyl-CoA:succinyl-CoA transferase